MLFTKKSFQNTHIRNKIIHIIQVQEIINNCDKPRTDGCAEERVVNARKKSTVTKIKTKKGQILNGT